MKEIKAIIRPNKLSALRDALVALPGFPGMTVTKVEGCSAPSRHVARQRIKDELTDYSPKMRIEIVAPDDVAEVIGFVASRPAHVNLDRIMIRPRDQASASRFNRRV